MKLSTSRRGFLGSALACATLPAASFAARQDPGAEDIRLGVATYSLRKFPRDRAIQMIKDLGVRYVSIKSFHMPYEDSPDEIAAAAKDFRNAGLVVLSGGNISLTKPEELRPMFQYAKAAGLPMMVCAPSMETLPEVERLVKEFDIKAAIHNHGPEDKHFPTPQSVLKAVKSMDKRMGLCIDIGHTARTGADIVESIKEAGPRLFDVHVKDLTDPMGKDTQVAVGDGALPVVAMFKQLKKMNYQGGVMLEYEIKADEPFPGMEKSFAYMKGVLAGLRG